MKTSTKILSILAGVASLGILPTAQAINLTPGASGTPTGIAATLGGTVIASETQNFVTATFTGSLFSEVLRGTTLNPTGLTFVYLVNNTGPSTDAIGRFTVNGWTAAAAGTTVNADYLIGTGSVPLSIDRTASSAGTIGFTYSPTDSIPAGGSSDLMVITTSSTTYVNTTGNVIDGSVASVPSYAPNVPDGGATSLLLGSGLLAIVTLRRKLCC